MCLRLPYSGPKGAKQIRLEQRALLLANIADSNGSDDRLPHVTDEPGKENFSTTCNVAPPMAKPSGAEAKESFRSWKREDLCRSKHVTTVPTGPPWKSVIRRTVYDLNTDEMIEDVQIDHSQNESEYQYDISVLESGGELRRNLKNNIAVSEQGCS